MSSQASRQAEFQQDFKFEEEIELKKFWPIKTWALQNSTWLDSTQLHLYQYDSSFIEKHDHTIARLIDFVERYMNLAV